MRVGITTFGSDGGRSGIGRYLVSLIEAMSRVQEQVQLDVSTFADEAEVFIPPDRVKTLRVLGPCPGPSRGAPPARTCP